MKELQDYIKGIRKGKKAHSLEREAMEDSFLQEALDGYEEVQGKHEENILRMQEEVLNRTRERKSYTQSYTLWYVAAGIALILSVGTLWWFLNERNETQPIAVNEQHTEEDRSLLSSDKEFLYELTDSVTEKNTAPITRKDKVEKSTKRREKSPEEIPLAMHQGKKQKVESVESYNLEQVAKPQPALSSSEDNRYRVYSDSKSIGSGADMLGSVSATEQETIMDRSVHVPTEPVVKDRVAKERVLAKRNENVVKKEKKNREVGKVNPSIKASPSIACDSFIEATPVIGVEKYNNYLKDGISLSEKDKCKDAKGTAIIRFEVDTEGIPYNIRVVDSLCSSIDSRLIELLKSGSGWTQGVGLIRFSL